MMTNQLKGWLFIIVGAFIFFVIAGPVLMQLLIAFCGLALINYGLRLRGRPPIFYFIASLLDRF